MTTWADDLLINGTSFSGIAGVTVPDWGPLLPVDVFRGANKPQPGIDGETGVELVRDAYDFTIAFDLKGSGASAEAARAAMLTSIGTIRGLFATSGLVTLTARLTSGAGTYADKTCNGQYRGLVWTDTTNPSDISGAITFRNLDGGWS